MIVGLELWIMNFTNEDKKKILEFHKKALIFYFCTIYSGDREITLFNVEIC